MYNYMIHARSDKCDCLHTDVLYIPVNMGTFEANADLKSFVMGNYSKVRLFTTRLESVEKYVTYLITEVRTEVELARWVQSTTHTEKETRRHDHHKLKIVMLG